MRPFNSSYDDTPAAYDRLRGCWLNERREKFLMDRLRGYGLPTGALVVEIGSGTGRLLNSLGKHFPDLEFLGIEPIEAYVEYSRKTSPGNVRYMRGTLEEAGAQIAERAMVVLSNDVLHHLPSYEAAARMVGRFASPCCRWLLVEPNAKNPYTFFRQWTGYGEQNFWPGRFERLADQHGWELQFRTHLFLIPPFVQQPSAWMKSLESRLERIPLLAGGVCLEFTKTGPYTATSAAVTASAAIT